ncbi:MAG: hypothetical protein C5B53_04730 [Candidatus Melainabacteria bacterium]|nr:MAG: hypothetical protein C5B53_04730 [Candidatus Melainabacteria bacterium]
MTSFQRSLLYWSIPAVILGPLSSGAYGTATADVEKPVNSASVLRNVLSAKGTDMAELLGIMPLIDKLSTLELEPSSDPAKELLRLKLKQQLTDKILIATLQVRDVTARIDREIARFDRIQGALESNRDRAIRLNSLANTVGMGLISEIGQAGELKVNENPGEITQLVGGGIGMALSGIALRQQSGGKQRLRPKPNMLAKIFNCRTDSDTEYPQVIWDYLNRVPVGSNDGQTRLELLLKHWQHYKYFGNLKMASSRTRIANLTNTSPRGVTNIALLQDQSDLLADVRSEVFQLDRDLLELLLNLQSL